MAAGRGSDKLWERLFGAETPKGEHLAEALSLAADEYTIKRWWKYGQPAIDLIRAVIEVEPANFAKVADSLIGLHGQNVQVKFEVFPYGIVAPDLLRLDLALERSVGR